MGGGSAKASMINYTYAVEMYLGGTWSEVTSDVRQTSPKVVSRGIDGTKITDRVAKVGTFSFLLDNSARNSGGVVGYYSPDNASCRSNFGLGIYTRFKIAYGGTTNYKFYGKLSDISPTFGLYKERQVAVQCVDYMNELLVHNLNKIKVQTNKRGNELLGTIVANLPTAPLVANYATGPDIFAYSLHDVKDETTSAMQAAQKVNQSGLSYLFTTGDVSGGEVLNWQTRHTRLLLSSIGTISDAMVNMTIRRKSDDIYNTIKATGYPVSVGTTSEVLWTSQREIIVPAGGTVTMTCRFADPTYGGKRVAVIPDTEVAPVADTDYKMSSVSENNGNDLNAYLTITPVWGGNAADLSLVNTSGNAGYVNLLKIRATILRLNDHAEKVSTDATSKITFGDRTLTFVLPYLDDINRISSFSAEILAKLKSAFSVVDSIEIIANDSATLMDFAMRADVGVKFTLIESVTGISQDYIINSYDLSQEAGGLLRCTLGNLEAASNVPGETTGMWGTGASDATEWGSTIADAGVWVF
jgi:hypothetical protein